MNRTEFLRFSLVGLSGAIVAPKIAVAQSSIDPKAGGLFYTAESPGRWSQKVGSHLPKLSINKESNGLINVRVTNEHPQDNYNHYIIKHQLLDQNFNYLTEHFFDPTQPETPVSEFNLTDYKGKLYALSFCNIHDVWLNSVNI